jgi:hypothetical protein
MSTLTPDWTLDELLAELTTPDEPLPGFLSFGEWMKQYRIGDHRLREVMQLALKAGRLDVRREKRTRIDGGYYYTPVYRILPRQP